MSKYLTETEVCELLRLDPRTMKRWRAAGKGPPHIKLEGLWVRYDPEAVRQWLAAQCPSMSPSVTQSATI